jgi:hypothetical protein
MIKTKLDQHLWVWMVLTAAAHMALGLSWGVPYAFRDEAAYLMNGSFIAGYGNVFGNQYALGVSLLYAPILLLVPDPYLAYKVFLALNAAAAASILWMVNSFAGLLRRGDLGHSSLLIAICLSLYPSLLLYANHALPEMMLALLYLACVWQLAAGLSEGAGFRQYLGMVTCAALLPLFHLRSFGVTAAMAITIFLIPHLKVRARLQLAGVLFALVATGMGLSLLFYREIAQVGFVFGDNYSSASRSILGGLAHHPWQFMYAWVCRLSGQLMYLCVSSAGLLPIGLFRAAQLMRRASKERFPPLPFFLLLSFVLSLAFSALVQTKALLVDKFIFGRYMEAFLLPLMVLGADALIEADVAGRIRYLGLAFTVFVANALFALLTYGPQMNECAATQPIRSWTISSLSGVVTATGTLKLQHILLWGTVVLVATSLAVRLLRKNRIPYAFIAVFALNSCLAVSGIIKPAFQQYRQLGSVCTMLREQVTRPATAVVGLGVKGNKWSDMDTKRFLFSCLYQLHDFRLRQILAETDVPGCDFVINDNADYASAGKGAVLLGRETDADFFLWRLPGK